MRFIAVVLVIALGAALVALALDPRTDVACMLAWARDAVDKSHIGWQCMHYAAARGDLSVLRSGLDHGASANVRTQRGQTPLILAAENGQLAAVQWLIRHGAELEARDGRNGFTALHWAVNRYRPAVARALLAAGAHVNAENESLQTPLWQAAQQTDQGNTEIARILVRAGANIHASGDQGNTPLLTAARAGHRPIAAYLLEQGADIEARNERGRTALSQAVASNHPDSVRLLLVRGADPNTRADGQTVLQTALNRGYREIANLLAANGATDYNRYASEAALARGRSAYIQGQYDEAIQAYNAAIALRPDSAEAYYRRSLAFRAGNLTDEAESDLERALELAPRHPPSRMALARLYIDQGHYGRAVTTLEPLLGRQPDNARALYLLGESRQRMGKTAKACAHFERSCTLGFQEACAH